MKKLSTILYGIPSRTKEKLTFVIVPNAQLPKIPNIAETLEWKKQVVFYWRSFCSNGLGRTRPIPPEAKDRPAKLS